MTCNVLYLTSRCNFACEYCYEHKGQDRASELFDLDENQAIKNVEDIIAKEPDPNIQTMIVLFGGEPTLNWDVCKKAAQHAFKLKENVFFCLSTNGWMFRHDEFCKDYIKFARSVNRQIGIDLSFDGIGNFRRKLLGGGETTQGMYKVLVNMAKYNIKYSLRYTIHQGNIDYAAKDLAIFDKYFKPDKYVLSYDNQNLDPEAVVRVKNDIRQQYIDGNITKPLCELVCDICKKCIKTGEYSYWSHGNIRNLAAGESADSFGDF